MERKIFCRLDKDAIQKAIIYCDCNEDDQDLNEKIIKSITSEYFIGKFNKDEYEYSDNKPIQNDNNLYVTCMIHGVYNVWQVCGKLCDMQGTIIPNAYRIRKIGFIVISDN